MTKLTLSPSVHEATVARHFPKDGTDDPILQGLHDGVRLARQMATKAATITDAVLANTLETEAARHKKARTAGFNLIEEATRKLDAAVMAAEHETATLKTRTQGPAPPKDLVTESRQRELRERLSKLSEKGRKAIVQQAISNDDDLLIGAILSAPAWLSGLSDGEVMLTRFNWAARRYPNDLDRLDRLNRAIEDAQRAGTLSISFVGQLTDHELIAEAEARDRKAAEALAAAKV